MSKRELKLQLNGIKLILVFKKTFFSSFELISACDPNKRIPTYK